MHPTLASTKRLVLTEGVTGWGWVQRPLGTAVGSATVAPWVRRRTRRFDRSCVDPVRADPGL